MQNPTRSRFLSVALALCGAAAFLVAGNAVEAHPTYLTTWQGLHPTSQSDDNVINGMGVGCALCHFTSSGGGSWNPYGWKVRQNLHAGQNITNSILNAATFDSDLDPTASLNSTEIGANTQPGWTPGPNNTKYTTSGTTTGQNPPATILGNLDPLNPWTAHCSPGLAGVIDCPCANPPAGAGRGCDNSEATGGASIGASGSASLASDTLVFITSGERATSTTIVLQGTSLNATGQAFGQGVRCVAGTLKRLYVKGASGGSITAPGAGDPSVSARSALLGDTISSGTTREYMAYYRDPIVLGGCAPSNSWNGTNGGTVAWSQ